MRIDTHQHFWHYDPVRYDWITDNMQRIRGDFLPADLAELLKVNNIDGCITVEAHQSEHETKFLLQLAGENDFIKGVIGWVDLFADDLPQRLRHFSAFKKFKGMRYAVQSEPDINFMRRTDFQRGLKYLKDFDFIYEILIFPPYLPAAIDCVKNNPQQKFVLNHIAKPYIRNKKMEPWRSHIFELAGFSNVHCKISGMVTEADWKHWQDKDLKPYIDVIVDAFGPERLMFGSDWPVCLLAAEYRQVLNVVEDYMGDFSADEKNRIMGLNAVNLYNLKEV